MGLYMDVHDTRGATPEELALAHLKDVEVQDRFDVSFLTYWLDYEHGRANCLVRAPGPDVVREAHDAAHGNIPGQIIEVEEAEVMSFLGRVTDIGPGPITEPATRTIVFTDIVGSTAYFDRHGDEAGMGMIRSHNRIVRSLIGTLGGREVKHTGDGFMLAFEAPPNGVSFGCRLQRRLDSELPSTRVRVGINTGEPVSEGGEFFGTAVTLASRLCDLAGGGEVYVSDVVRELTMGDGFGFSEVGRLEVKGFSDPVLVHQVVEVP